MRGGEDEGDSLVGADPSGRTNQEETVQTASHEGRKLYYWLVALMVLMLIRIYFIRAAIYDIHIHQTQVQGPPPVDHSQIEPVSHPEQQPEQTPTLAVQ